MLTKKDFLAYLAKGGSVGFNKPIKLNRKQLKVGREPINIEGKVGYLDGKGYWTPKDQMNK